MLLFASVTVFFVGCSSSSYSLKTFRVVETADNIVSTPLVVEYDTIFCTSVSDTSTFQFVGNKRDVNFELLKKNATANCCAKYGIDVLVNVSYSIYTKRNVIYVAISGLPARYKRIRPATKDDLWMLQNTTNK